MDDAPLDRLYRARFTVGLERRDAMWRVLCRDYFQRWVAPDAIVLDVAAGNCEFINNIQASERIAVDLNFDVKERAAEGVRVHVGPSTVMSEVESGSVDVAFVSNFFEHLSREDILLTLAEIRRVLAPGGRLLVLQPNIRYCARDFWMFFDHITPLDHYSLVEALGIERFEVEHLVKRFLPFTTKGKLPSRPWLVAAYLRVPLAWRVLGAQTFVVARITS